nr:MFS transporter [Mycobacterium sp. OAS707]
MSLRNCFARQIPTRLADAVGGPARLRVAALLALTVGLEAADNGTIGALVVPLKNEFHINNTQIGLLVTASTITGVAATLPAGVLTDHINRTRLLCSAILFWSVAMVFSGLGFGYTWLLGCRVALGALVAVAGPAVASLLGDYFPIIERGRIYGYVLAGEGICTAAGLELSGVLATLNWRLGFWWLAICGLALGVAVAKWLPEPARGGTSRTPIGATHIRLIDEPPTPAPDPTAAPPGAGDNSTTTGDDTVAHQVRAQHVQPHTHLILTENPQRQSLWWALRYVLSVRTNVVLIIGSSLGYFFFTGLGTFGLALLRGRFHIGQAQATLLIGLIGVGALIGALTSGRLADWLISRGHISARMTVAGTAFLLAALFALPALLSHSLVATIGLAALSAIGLGGANPPLDAGRLDIMHSGLWGRAEAVRTALRSLATALAPLLFGIVSTHLGAPTHPEYATNAAHLAGTDSTSSDITAATGTGLDQAFLVMLIPLVSGGAFILAIARRTYPPDVATAMASEHATAPPP